MKVLTAFESKLGIVHIIGYDDFRLPLLLDTKAAYRFNAKLDFKLC